MDEVLKLLSDSTVQENKFENSSQYEFPFKSLYKNHQNGENSQEKRRKILLDHQKQKRHNLLDDKRIIPCLKFKNSRFENILMYSEWLVEIPSDFCERWAIVPCPIGKRSIICAKKGITKSYSKSGVLLKTFKSYLPGGSPSNGKNETILDSIWNSDTMSFYILDVLCWNGKWYVDYDTEFRFFWLKSQINELNEPISIKQENNRYPFYILPYISCKFENLKELFVTYPIFGRSLEENELMEIDVQKTQEKIGIKNKMNIELLYPPKNVCGPLLDGLLFYHLDNFYESGHTPLVGWLKPYMIEDILDIPVNPKFNENRPPSYINLQKHIEESKKEKHNWWSKHST